MRILLLDNYDSYTYNLKQYFVETELCTVKIVKNDVVTKQDIDQCDALVLSPGPGLPYESGRLIEMIQYTCGKKPIFGVCLGQQAIAEAFGGSLENLSHVYHGISSKIRVCDPKNPVFTDIVEEIWVGRYHSWVVKKEGFPSELEISATDDEGNIMALRHKNLPVYAVQFHPESILTPLGRNIITNFLRSVKIGLIENSAIEI